MGLDYAIDLYFPIEKIKDALLETIRMSVPRLNEEGYEEIGYIYLTLHLGAQYVRFRFYAATSDMSRLFLRSKSIHKRMSELLHVVGGIIGLISIETSEWPLLEDSSQKIDIDEEDYLQTEEEYWKNSYSNVDRFLETILQAPRSYFQEK